MTPDGRESTPCGDSGALKNYTFKARSAEVFKAWIESLIPTLDLDGTLAHRVG
jgi:hypothetical protein